MCRAGRGGAGQGWTARSRGHAPASQLARGPTQAGWFPPRPQPHPRVDGPWMARTPPTPPLPICAQHPAPSGVLEGRRESPWEGHGTKINSPLRKAGKRERRWHDEGAVMGTWLWRAVHSLKFGESLIPEEQGEQVRDRPVDGGTLPAASLCGAPTRGRAGQQSPAVPSFHSQLTRLRVSIPRVPVCW